MNNTNINIKRGQLVWVDLQERNGACQFGQRPAVVVQNNTGNIYSPSTMVLPITTKKKGNYPVHAELSRSYDIAQKGNVIMAEQLRVIDKSQIMFTGDLLDDDDIRKVNKIMTKQLGLQ